MPNSEFQELTSFLTEGEAEQVRGILEEHGVDAFINGANAANALSYVGSALGGVKLFVRASEMERAIEVVQSLEEDTPNSGP